jgi:MYXO-CTERM domain-containing protein
VQVDWETAQETQNQGFNLWRGTSPAGPDVRLNAAILPSQNPGGTMGASYRYVDSYQLTSSATYYYWLEDVSLSGKVTRHEPVSVPYTGPTAVRLRDARAAGSVPAAWPLAGIALLALGAAALIRRRTA